MMALNRAINNLDEEYENINSEEESNSENLSKQEIQDIEERKTSIKKLAEEKNQLDQAAIAELNNLVIAKEDQDALINLKEYKHFKSRLEETDSPDDTRKILEEIKNIAKNKEKKFKKDQEESLKLNPEDPKLLSLENRFNNICEENKDYIGLKQVEEFKIWFREQRRKTPNVKSLKEIIKKLEGKEISDKNGLAPRKEEYNKLDTIFKKYGLSSPLESEWIRIEGLSERTSFRKNLEKFEKHLDKIKDTGFYSKEAIQNMMQEMLLAQTPSIQSIIIDKAKSISKKESEAFVYLDSTINIAGITIRKMSKASKKTYLDYYKNTNSKERSELVVNWKTIVDHEAKLAKELEEIYKNQPKELLQTALKSFEELDFMYKEKSLNEHRNLMKNLDTNEDLEKTLIIKAAHAKIDAAANDKIIAKGEGNTQGRYKKFFKNMDNFKNPETGKKGDTNQIKKGFKILTDQKISVKYKNLTAYKKRKEDFEKDLKSLKELNPNIKKEELNKWEEKYNQAGWTDREKIHQISLKKEINKSRQNKSKENQLKELSGLKESNENQELNLDETIKAVQELILNEQGAEAMKVLLKYNETDPDNPKILFWIQTVASYMKEFGSGKKIEEKNEDEMENVIKEVVSSDSEIEDELEEQQIKELNIEGAEMSEARHNKTLSARDRAKKESINNKDSLEERLTKSAYEEIDENYILDEESKAKKLEDISFTESKMISKDRANLKENTYQEQTKIHTKEGFTNVNLKDKNGRKISAKEAQVFHEEKQTKLSQKITDKAEERFKTKKTGQKDQISNLYTKISAKRKAKKLIDQKSKEKIKL